MIALSVKQTAEALNLSSRTIYRRIEKGEIRILQSNGVIRIPVEQFALEDDSRNKRIWGYAK